MKTIAQCKIVLAKYMGGPVVLAAGIDAVAHAEALLESTRQLLSVVLDVLGACDCGAGDGCARCAAAAAIDRAEPPNNKEGTEPPAAGVV